MPKAGILWRKNSSHQQHWDYLVLTMSTVLLLVLSSSGQLVLHLHGLQHKIYIVNGVIFTPFMKDVLKLLKNDSYFSSD